MGVDLLLFMWRIEWQMIMSFFHLEKIFYASHCRGKFGRPRDIHSVFALIPLPILWVDQKFERLEEKQNR